MLFMWKVRLLQVVFNILSRIKVSLFENRSFYLKKTGSLAGMQPTTMFSNFNREISELSKLKRVPKFRPSIITVRFGSEEKFARSMPCNFWTVFDLQTNSM